MNECGRSSSLILAGYTALTEAHGCVGSRCAPRWRKMSDTEGRFSERPVKLRLGRGDLVQVPEGQWRLPLTRSRVGEHAASRTWLPFACFNRVARDTAKKWAILLAKT